MKPLTEKSINYDQIAELYDLHVRDDFDVTFYIQEANQASGAVLELMAGTGRVSLPLVAAGVKLTCLDYSQSLLSILSNKLRAKGLKANICHEDVRDFDLGKVYQLIFIAFNAFSEICDVEDQRGDEIPRDRGGTGLFRRDGQGQFSPRL